MAWGESKAWKRGSAHQKLYQSLLEDAPEYDAKVVLTAELVEKYLKRRIKEPA